MILVLRLGILVFLNLCFFRDFLIYSCIEKISTFFFFKIMIRKISKDFERDGCGLFEGTILERLRKNHDSFIGISSSRTEIQIGCLLNMNLACCTPSNCQVSVSCGTRLGDIFIEGSHTDKQGTRNVLVCFSQSSYQRTGLNFH